MRTLCRACCVLLPPTAALQLCQEGDKDLSVCVIEKGSQVGEQQWLCSGQGSHWGNGFIAVDAVCLCFGELLEQRVRHGTHLKATWQPRAFRKQQRAALQQATNTDRTEFSFSPGMRS